MSRQLEKAVTEAGGFFGVAVKELKSSSYHILGIV